MNTVTNWPLDFFPKLKQILFLKYNWPHSNKKTNKLSKYKNCIAFAQTFGASINNQAEGTK